MSPARIPDDDSLRAPPFPPRRRPAKTPAGPQQEPSKSPPAGGERIEGRPSPLAEVRNPIEEENGQ
jgi:hypothetical protein